MNKICVVCGKPLTGKQRTLCSNRECHRERKRDYDREHYQKNTEKILKNRHTHYRKNAEKIKEYNREHGRKYRLNNPEKKKEYLCEYYQRNKERIKKHYHEYYLSNREKILKCRHKRYRCIRGLPEDWDLSRESSIEVIMKRWLQESDIEFVQQYYINFEDTTNTRVDFYIPEANVCLYVDGDYWHALPEVQERDVEQNKILASLGYSVVRMTETEILDGNRPWWIGELISTKW